MLIVAYQVLKTTVYTWYHPLALALAFSFYNSNELLAYMHYAYHAMLDGHIKNFVLNI
jgi:hypothetical protein